MADVRHSSAPPRPALPFRGRQAELDDVCRRIGARGGLVVLCGSGGVGKTRLAVAVAHRWQETHSPVSWVDLQSVCQADDLKMVVAHALGARRASEVPGLLREMARGLLVLDNLEQLPDEAFAVIAAWVRGAPSLRVVCTSRRRLNVDEAQHIPIHSLPIPTESTVFDDPAWAILEDRSERTIRVAPADAVRLLRTLDGLPLALLLAAARLEVLTEGDLLDRLEDPLPVLVDPERPHARHGSLTHALAWSWSLLAERDRDALGKLAGFRGHFDLRLAEAAVPGDPTLLDRLHRGVRAHLLTNESGWFRWPVPARAYVRELLGTAGWATAVQQHATALATWLDTETQRHAPNRLAEVHTELRALLERASLLRPADGPTVLKAGLALSQYVLARLGVDDMHEVVQTTLALATGAPEETEVAEELRCLHGHWHISYRRYDRAEATFEAVLQATRSPSHAFWFALEGRAVCAMLVDDLPRAADLLQGILELPGVLGGRRLRIRSLLAETLAHLGERERSRPLVEQVYAEVAERPPSRLLVTALTAAGGAALQNGDAALSLDIFSTARDIAQRLESPFDCAVLRGRLGRARIVFGDVAAGLAELEASIDELHGLGHHVQACSYGIDRARCYAVMGRWNEVRDALEDAETQAPPARRKELQRLMRLAHAVEHLPPPECAQDHDDAVFDGLVAGFTMRGPAVQAAIERVREALATSGLAPEWVEVVEAGVLALGMHARTWRVASDGSWFEGPDGVRVDLHRRKAYARVLAFLLHRRQEEPGSGADTEALFSAGWPGQHAGAKSAANRVHVALSSLRKLGLAPLLRRDRPGWRLYEDVPVLEGEDRDGSP